MLLFFNSNNCGEVRMQHTLITKNKKTMMFCLRDPGIEPGSVPWQGTILPLNQPRMAGASSLKSRVSVPAAYLDTDCPLQKFVAYLATAILRSRLFAGLRSALHMRQR